MRAFSGSTAQLSSLKALRYDAEVGRSAAVNASVPSDRVCFLIDMHELMDEVAAEVHPLAPTLLRLEAENMTWRAIGVRTELEPMQARTIYYDAVGLCVCDERVTPRAKDAE